MSSDVYWKARTFIKRDQVKLISADKGHLHFKVKGHDVFRNGRGDWSCNAARLVENKPKKRKAYLDAFDMPIRTPRYRKLGCILFGQGKVCSHIRAAQLWLQGYDLNEKNS